MVDADPKKGLALPVLLYHFAFDYQWKIFHQPDTTEVVQKCNTYVLPYTFPVKLANFVAGNYNRFRAEPRNNTGY